MKTLDLKIGERLMLNRLVNEAGKGITYSDLRLVMKILDRIVIEEEEEKKVKFTKKNNQFSWEDTRYSKEIEFSDDEIKYMNKIIDERDKEKRFLSTDGKHMVDLIDKIKTDEQ